MAKKPMSDEEKVLREGQHCYVSDGKMFCNFIVRCGKRINPKVKDYLTFPAKTGWKGKIKANKRGKPLVQQSLGF